MSDLTGDGFEDEGDLILAEYVLGVLPRAERAEIARRVETDPETARGVAAWEQRLSGLNAAYEPVSPPAHAFARIQTRLFPDREASAGVPWYERLGFWRAATAGAFAVALVSLGVNLMPLLTPAPETGVMQVASLSAAEENLMVMTLYDPGTGMMRLTASGAEAPAGNDYELWVLPPEQDPVSLGIFAPGTEGRPVAPDTMEMMDEGVSLAISMEPEGGSPTGAPTGPVLVVAPVERMA